jgi:hypothetical protein
VTGGEVITGVPGKYARRIMLVEPGSVLNFGGKDAGKAPKLRILEQLIAGAGPKHGGEMNFSGHGKVEVGHDLTVGRWGEGKLTVTGGNIDLSVGGDFWCAWGGQWCEVNYVIDATGASTIKLAKDIRLGHGKKAFNRSKFTVRFPGGFKPKAGTEYVILASTGGKFANYPTFGNVENGQVIEADGVRVKAAYTDSSFKLIVQ